MNKSLAEMKKAYRWLFKDYYYLLNRELAGASSILDVGCGTGSPLKDISLSAGYKVGVDAFEEAIEESRKQQIHHDYHQENILKIDTLFKPNSFDCVIALDLIEHLTRDEGMELIEKMERISSRKIIIFTPNGFIPQGDHRGNPWQAHKSGWHVSDFRQLGFSVWGVHGPKWLRDDSSSICLKPQKMWTKVSLVSQSVTCYLPQTAFQLFCVKEK